MIRRTDILDLLTVDQWTSATVIVRAMAIRVSPEQATRLYVSQAGGKEKRKIRNLGDAVSQGKRRAVMIAVNKMKSDGLIEGRGRRCFREFRLLPAGIEYRKRMNDKSNRKT